MKLRHFLALFAALFILTSCSKSGPKALLLESKELAAKGDPESWEQVRVNLKDLIRNHNIPEDEDGAQIYNFYVQSLIKTGRHDEALLEAEKNINRFPQNFLSNYLLGKLYYDSGRMAQAVSFLEEAEKINPGNVNTMTLLLAAASKANHPKGDTYFAGMQAFKNDSKFYNEWGCWLMNQGQYRKALARFAESKRKPNADPAATMNLAVLYDQHLNMKKAAKKYYMRYLYEMGKYPDSRIATRKMVQNRIREMARR